MHWAWLPKTCQPLVTCLDHLCKHCLIIRHGNKHHPFSKPHILAETYQAALQRLKQLHPDAGKTWGNAGGWGEDSNISATIRSTTTGFVGASSVTNSGEFDGFRKVNVESQSSLAGITLKLVDRIPMNIPQEIYKME